MHRALKATHRTALAELDALFAQAAAAGVCGGVVIQTSLHTR